MSIKEIVNPLTNKKQTIVSGVVSAIYMNELKTKRDYGKDGKSWIPTHSVNIVIDGDKVGLGLTDKEVLRVKDADDKYHDLVKGLEVTIPVTVGEYNGKPQYNGFSSGITVIGTDGVEKAQHGSGGFKQPMAATKRDFSGIISGNGFNAAKAFLGGLGDKGVFIDHAIRLVDIGQIIRDKLKASRPDLDDFSVGAQSGMALIAACEWTDDLGDVEDIALVILEEILPRINDHVKELDNPVQKPQKPEKKVVKPEKRSVATSVVEHDSDDGFDDDTIPF